MANYCITKYWVEGEKTVLAKLASLIGDGQNVTEILPKMGMPFSELGFREEGCPYWYNAGISNGILSFTEEAKWEQSQCLWKLRDSEESGISDIKYYSVISESDDYQTNDADGKYFPYRVSVFCALKPDTDPPHFYVVSEDNTFLFRTKEDMLSYFMRQFGWMAKTEEELRCMAEKNGYCLYAEKIEVVSGPFHLGLNKMKFDFEKGDDGIIHVTIKE